MKFIRRFITAYKLTREFDFTEADFPEVIESPDVEGLHLPDKRRIRYYRVGRWEMEDIDPDPDGYSDANPSYARDAILSWMAWMRFVRSRSA